MSRFVLLLPIFLAACGPDADPGPVHPASKPSASVAPIPVAIPKNVPRLAEKRPATHTYFGTTVTDDYEYLEDPKAPEVADFEQTQTNFTTAQIGGHADRPALEARVSALFRQASQDFLAVRHAGHQLFLLVERPPKQQPLVVTRNEAGEASSEKIVLDPAVLDPTNKTTIDWFVPSPDGKTIAISLSKNGSEEGDAHLFDVATGREKGEIVSHVQSGKAGGSLAWNEQGNGFYYTHNGDHQEAWFHKIGEAESKDTYAIGKDFPSIAEVELTRSDDGKTILARVQKGDGGEYEHHVLSNGKWIRLTHFADAVTSAHFGADGKLYAVSKKDAPKGAVIVFAPPFEKASPVLPEGDGVIADIVITKSALYAIEVVGGPSRVRRMPLGEKAEPLASEPGKGKKKPTPPTTIQPGERGFSSAEIPLLPVSSVTGVERIGDDLLIRNASYLEPPAWYRYTAKEHRVVKTTLAKASPVDMSDIEVVRESCLSKDGTKVPMSILRKKGMKLTGDAPALVTGYGGFGVGRRPYMRTWWRLWLDQGGIVADTNLRGGNEFGEVWHTGGSLTKKQNVFDDFAACVKAVSTLGYTNPAHTAIMGGSNGGLLMGATIVQHPELFRAAVAQVGIYDMLHYELTPNGAFNTTEYGSTKDEAQFKALYAYSPFHNVKDNVPYPSVLFMTGANDPRVDPYNSRKMAARLQAATSSSNPIMLRTSHDTGHGMGTPLDAEIEEIADELSFLFHELGVSYQAH